MALSTRFATSGLWCYIASPWFVKASELRSAPEKVGGVLVASEGSSAVSQTLSLVGGHSSLNHAWL